LSADPPRHGAADEEHQQAEQQVHRADVFVIGREDPAPPALLRAVVSVMLVLVMLADGMRGLMVCNAARIGHELVTPPRSPPRSLFGSLPVAPSASCRSPPPSGHRRLPA